MSPERNFLSSTQNKNNAIISLLYKSNPWNQRKTVHVSFCKIHFLKARGRFQGIHYVDQEAFLRETTNNAFLTLKHEDSFNKPNFKS